MEENEGKDLAVNEKEELLSKIKEIEERAKQEKDTENVNVKYYDKIPLKLGESTLEVSVAEIEEIIKGEKEGQEQRVIIYDIYMQYDGQDVLIGKIDENGELTLNKETIKQMDPENRLGLQGLKKNDKMNLSILKEMEGKTKEELEEELQKSEKSVKDEPELDDEENEQEKSTQLEESAEKDIKKDNKRLIPLNSMIFKQLMPSMGDYNNLYIDSQTNQIVGKNQETGEIEELDNLNDIGNNMADMSICGIEDGNHKDLQAIKMYRIGNSNTGFAIIRDGTEKGNLDIKYIVRPINSQDEKDHKYVNLPMLESNGKIGLNQVKERAGIRQGREQGANINEAVEEMHGIQEDDRLGETMEALEQEMQPNGVTSIEELKEKLTKIFMEDKGWSRETAEYATSEVIDKDRKLDNVEKEINKDKQEKEKDEDPYEKVPWPTY